MQHISKIIRKQPNKPNDPASDIVKKYCKYGYVRHEIKDKNIVIVVASSAAAGSLRVAKKQIVEEIFQVTKLKYTIQIRTEL